MLVGIGCIASAPLSCSRTVPPATGASEPARVNEDTPVKPAPEETPEAVDARLEQATRDRPSDASAWAALGDHRYAYHRPEEAERAWARSLELDAAQADLLWKLGTLDSGRDDDASAEQHYRAALRVDPRHTGALHNLGSIHFSRGELTRAEDLLRRAIAADGGAEHLLGRVLAAQGRHEEAAVAYRQSLVHPGNGLLALALINADLGAALMELGQDADAAAALNAALDAYHDLQRHPAGYGRDTPAVAETHYRLARVTSRTGDTQQALWHLGQAVSLQPSWLDKARDEADLAAVRRLPGWTALSRSRE